MSFSKKKREAVYAKYDGHCAYCGRACVYNGPVSTGGDDFCSHGELQTNGGGNNNVSD